MSVHAHVAIFWDYENCNPPSSSTGLGYDIVHNIGRIARLFGSVTTFRAYLDVSTQSAKSVPLRSELQSSGVSLVDCPHNGRKDVVDKMILVDMLAFAVDHPAPATIILIAGDRDYAYAVSTLKLRKYHVILVAPSSPHTSPSLESQASLVVDWGAAALRTSGTSAQAVRQPYPELDPDVVTKLLKELQIPDPDATSSSASQTASRLQRVSTRELLEPSRHCKNTASLGLAQEFTSASTSSGSDSRGVPSVPKTPSRSRGASDSTGSTRARSSTAVEQLPLAVEQNTPAKGSQPSIPSISDATYVFGPVKRGPPELSSLDTLELTPHDSCPPSSIIVRSPLEPSRPMPDSARPSVLSSHSLNGPGSPFVVPKTTTPPSFYAKPSRTAFRPISAAAKTPKRKDPDDPEEIERVSRLLFDDDSDTDSVRSIPHTTRSDGGTRDTADTPMSNYHTCATHLSTYSLSSTNVGAGLADSSPCKRASPAVPTPPGVSDRVDAQFSAFSRASNALGRSTPSSESVLSSGSFPSSPFTAPESYERDETGQGQAWRKFEPLVRLLLAARERGIIRASRSTIAVELLETDKQVYRRAGVLKFRDYSALAEEAGIIELGGTDGGAWIALHPNWFGMDGVTPAHLSSGISSPMSEPPRAIQSPLLSRPKTPPMEQATAFQSPRFGSPQFASPKHGNTLPPSPSNRQVGASSWASIPAQFQPLIDVLVRMRAEGSHQPLRSVLGPLLDRGVYARAGVPGFKVYVHQASEARLVQLGGGGGRDWIRLHPDLRI